MDITLGSGLRACQEGRQVGASRRKEGPVLPQAPEGGRKV
jgi:hypothetical protein